MSDKKVTYSTHHGVFQGDTLDEAIELANEMATHIEKAKDTAVRYRVAVSERQPSEQARVEPGELGTCPIHGGGQTADAQRAIEAFENGSLRPDVLDEAAELRARAEKARVRGSRIAARTGRADYQEGKADGLDEAASLVESSQEALVKLAERLEAQAKMATQSVTYWEKRGADIRAQDESRLATLLREAASALTTYEQALGAAAQVVDDLRSAADGCDDPEYPERASEDECHHYYAQGESDAYCDAADRLARALHPATRTEGTNQ